MTRCSSLVGGHISLSGLYYAPPTNSRSVLVVMFCNLACRLKYYSLNYNFFYYFFLEPKEAFFMFVKRFHELRQGSSKLIFFINPNLSGTS